MSPTSYQAAPPRDIVFDRLGRLGGLNLKVNPSGENLLGNSHKIRQIAELKILATSRPDFEPERASILSGSQKRLPKFVTGPWFFPFLRLSAAL